MFRGLIFFTSCKFVLCKNATLFSAYKSLDSAHSTGYVFVLVINLEYKYNTTQFSCQIVSSQIDIPVYDLPTSSSPSYSYSVSRGRRFWGHSFHIHQPFSFPMFYVFPIFSVSNHFIIFRSLLNIPAWIII
jgi:hypothetical protein